MSGQADKALAVIIVSYNTKDELRDCLRSIFQSRQGISYEIWVVDNASPDCSADVVEVEFPQVKLIRCSENTGFSKANNLAIRASATDFVLLLNPDTIISDGVFSETIRFLKEHSDVGMVSCKLVKADGNLDLACRRSFPSVFDGFCRAIGLSALMPHSPLFARYNLTFLPQDEAAEVDAINGAFMMVRREALKLIGLLDEDFFMYMEDLDWCYRFRRRGWKIYYEPTTTIIHLKGQAGKKSSGRMIRAFFESMELFCQKHYRSEQSALHYAMTIAGIRTWMWMTVARNSLRTEKQVRP